MPPGVRLVEADLRLFRGRLEVRHLKSLRPLPILWDRWKLEWRRTPLVLADLVAASAPAELLLDLKGRRIRLAQLVADALRPHVHERPFTVCARSWRLLEPFRELPVRRIHSVGSRKQLRELLRGRVEIEGVSIHERLLDPATLARLREVAPLVLTWPVNDLARARELVALGVQGLITDRADLVAPIAA